MQENIRVFISYSHEDVEMVEQIICFLEEDHRIMVLGSKALKGGAYYFEELMVFIEHSHIFMPVITKSSSARGWVHQEIGYAIGLHIPVYPVLIGNVKPVGFIESIHAIKLSNNSLILREQLSFNNLSSLLKDKQLPALFQQATRVEERAELMKRYADKVESLEKFGLVRQKGGLSSYHIPNKRITHKDWDDRYHPGNRSSHHKELQLEERIALQKHAEKEGCMLIVNTDYAFKGGSTLSAISRLNTLVMFLQSMPNDKVTIAFQNSNKFQESLTMVGDWFLAESVSFKDGDGFTNTFFTRNASEINKRIKSFDEELYEILENNGWTIQNSREKAIEELNSVIIKHKK
jgi:hypothetical protein